VGYRYFLMSNAIDLGLEGFSAQLVTLEGFGMVTEEKGVLRWMA